MPTGEARRQSGALELAVRSVTGFLLVVHMAGAAGMAGIGWFVETVHYPLFPYANGTRWTGFHESHARRTTWIVAAPWAAEGVSALALLALLPDGVPAVLCWAAALLAGVTVVATVAFALPAHARLAREFDPAVHRRLLRTGWVRTVAWTAAGVVGGWMLLAYVGAG